jgi:hypothetical protein
MILIVSQHRDIQAMAVRWALERLGVECRMLDLHDAVANGSISVDLDHERIAWRCPQTGQAQQIHLDRIDCVWLRRGNRAFDLSRVDPRDTEVVQHELVSLARSIEALVATHARACVNPPGIQGVGDQKALQLSLAKRAGLQVPATLMSNHVASVRAFHALHAPLIVKPFNQNGWLEGDDERGFVQHTAALSEADLRHAQAIELCPGIYQPRIDKHHELRITALGDDFRAVRIDSQDVPEARIDWRADYFQRASIEPVRLPDNIEQGLRALMRGLRLRFGCIDMIVTPDGRYVFLEINQQGQFLWMEERDPSIDLLNRFARFLCEEGGVACNDAHPTMRAYLDSRPGAADLALRRQYADEDRRKRRVAAHSGR